MKATRFLFLMLMMIGAGLLQGESLALQSNSASQPTFSRSREQSDSHQQKNGEVRGEKEQTRPAQADEGPKPLAGAPRTAKHRPRKSNSKPVSNHQLRPANTPTTNSLRSNTPGSITRLQQTASNAVTGVPSKAVNRHNVPASPPAASVNGQQFKSSRDPGARLASSGGPLTAARGTAAINGTNMKRKP